MGGSRIDRYFLVGFVAEQDDLPVRIVGYCAREHVPKVMGVTVVTEKNWRCRLNQLFAQFVMKGEGPIAVTLMNGIECHNSILYRIFLQSFAGTVVQVLFQNGGLFGGLKRSEECGWPTRS